MKNLALFFIFSLCSAASALAVDVQEIENIVNKHHQLSRFHGNIEVRQNDQIIFKKSLGIANHAFDIPHTDQSKFMIASVSKQLTAAAVLVLVDQGLVDLDKPYSDYYALENGNPETLAGWDSFTVRQLLTHTAGLIRDVKASPYFSPESYTPIIQRVVRQTTDHYNVFMPEVSEEGNYSNFGYMLLAQLVEKVSKIYFHDFLKKEIFIPLGMKSTGQYHRMFAIKNMADGYLYTEDIGKLQKRCCLDTTSFAGSHSLYSNVADLMTWLTELTALAPQVLSKSSQEMMTQAHNPMKYSESQYGFGVFVDSVEGHKRIWHDGWESGYLSLVSAMPSLGLQIVILGNRHGDGVYFGDYYSQQMNEEITALFTKSQ